MITIIRNNKEYGPYDERTVAEYVRQGRLLLHDRAHNALTGHEGTVEELLAVAGLHPEPMHRGTLRQQLNYIGRAFIFPKDDIGGHRLMDDKRLLVLAVAGLSLSIIMMLPIGGYLVFYAVSLYFATIWGLFFAYMFSTRQISRRTAIYTFFLTQAGVFVIFSGLNRLNVFYTFTSAPFPLSILGYIGGVGITEELAKMVPLLLLNGAMNCFAWFRSMSAGGTAAVITAVGALMFYVSDCSLFFVRFDKNSRLKTHFLVMLTYSLGELLIVLGLILK